MANTKGAREPRFMDMTPDELRTAYWTARHGAASWNKMTTLGGWGGRAKSRIAGKVLSHLDRIDLIVNCARKRGIALTGTPEADAAAEAFEERRIEERERAAEEVAQAKDEERGA